MTIESTSPAATPLLSLKGIVKRFGRMTAVDHVDFNVHAGEIVGILGIAGNGQTEMVEAITGLRKPSVGRVVINGKDVTGADPGVVRAAS